MADDANNDNEKFVITEADLAAVEAELAAKQRAKDLTSPRAYLKREQLTERELLRAILQTLLDLRDDMEDLHAMMEEALS